MSKFKGIVGYVFPYEHSPGIWMEKYEEQLVSGDVLKHARGWENGEGISSTLTLKNQISILANDYAFKNCSAIRYVRWMNTDWEVKDVEIQYPRIILTLGGVYNGTRYKRDSTS